AGDPSTSWRANRKASSRLPSTRPPSLSSSPPSLHPPPTDRLLDPLIEVWEADHRWVRCHNVRFGASEFNPGLGGGRFHPFEGPDGGPVPTLYGASSVDGALSETVFHAVPLRGP